MVILCDFDDTAADRNIATLLLDRFQANATAHGAPHWHDLRDRFVRNEITLAQYQEMTFSRLATPHVEQADHVKKSARLRAGFPELASYCRQTGVELAIVSHGLDFYIQALLEGADMGYVPYFAVKTAEVDGVTTFHYSFTEEDCSWWPGNCKCSVLRDFRKRGHEVIYAGDGASDACPAKQADFVFARDSLLRFCQANGLPHQELTDFYVVLDYLKKSEAEAHA